MADNLLRNASFEDGAYPFDPNGIVWIPKEWQFTFREGEADKLPRQQLAWGRPHAGCISPPQVPDHERPLFFIDGQVIWKLWSGDSWPFYITLSQTLTLAPGAGYRFAINVFPDMVQQYAPQGKVFSGDPDAGLIRLAARSGGQTFTTQFFNGQQMPFGRYATLALDFAPPAAEASVTLEAVGLLKLPNTGYFFDKFSLEQVAAASEPVLPSDVVIKLMEALNARDLDALLRLYNPNAALVTPRATHQGHPAIRAAYADLFKQLPGAKFTLGQAQDVGETSCNFAWTAKAGAKVAAESTDTVGVLGGKLEYHSMLYQLR